MIEQRTDALPLRTFPAYASAMQASAAIRLGRGLYREKLFWEGDMLALSGAGREETVLDWADGAKAPGPDGEKLGTFRSYTAFLGGGRVWAHDLTIRNSAGGGETAGQAVSAYVDAAEALFENVRFFSRQDTLFCAPLPMAEREPGGFRGPREHTARRPSVQVYSNCLIEGDVDFIFGGADAIFIHCEIRSLDKGTACNGFTAAPSGPAGGLGLVFLDCDFTTDSAAPESVYLGRPWRPEGKMTLLHCRLGAHISAAGFSAWQPGRDEPQAFFAEYGCAGPGAQGPRAPFAKQLDAAQAAHIEAAALEKAVEVTSHCRQAAK